MPRSAVAGNLLMPPQHVSPSLTVSRGYAEVSKFLLHFCCIFDARGAVIPTLTCNDTECPR